MNPRRSPPGAERLGSIAFGSRTHRAGGEHDGARLDEPDERDAADARRRAEAARSGSLGPDWQRVQQRIDGGRTTLADVFSGTDTSLEARRLVERSRAVLTEARSDAQDDPTGMSATVIRDMEDLRERLRAAAGGRWS